MLKKLYDKSKILFAVMWIVVYCVSMSAGDALSAQLGTEKAVTLPVGLFLSAVLLGFFRKYALFAEYGFCRSQTAARPMLFYLPVLLMLSANLWHGVTVKYGIAETVLYILSMFCVGFLEEVIFRGLLFNALKKDNVVRAVIISSLTFGIGHIVNLLNGAEVLATLLQIVYATAAGFLFTVIFLCSGSLVPCIVTHCAINSFSAVAGESSALLDMITAAVLTVVATVYALWILKKNREERK